MRQMLDQLIMPHNTIQLWLVSLRPEDHPNFRDYHAQLNQTEQQRAQAFRFEQDQTKFIITHAVLRQLLGTYLQQDPTDIIFSHNNYHKPFLADHTLEFNLSHSGEWALFAFANSTKLGIDIEQDKPLADFLALGRQFLSDQELTEFRQFKNLEKQRQAFYNAWCAKEAFIKAKGLGFHYPVKDLILDLSNLDQPSIKTIANDNKNDWQLIRLNTASGYHSALCYQSKVPLKIQMFSLEKA